MTYETKNNENQEAKQETQQQPGVIAVTVKRPQGFCVTNYTSDQTAFLHPGVLTVGYIKITFYNCLYNTHISIQQY